MDFSKKDKEILDWLDNDVNNQDELDGTTKKEIEDLQPILETVGQFKVPPVDTAVLFKKIKQQISDDKKAVKVIPFRRWVSIVAAVFVMVFVCVYVMDRGVSITSDALIVSHQLPDNSEVILNRGSELTYEKDFVKDRILSLKGEAFFEVEKGESFVVSTPMGKVEVLGTSFNVNTFNKQLSVICKTGKVSVSAFNKQYILTPGKAVFIKNPEDVALTDVPLPQIANWTNQTSSFENVSLIEVVEELSTIYNIQINLPLQYHDQKYSGFFIHNDMDKALKAVFLPMNIHYEIDKEGKVVILD